MKPRRIRIPQHCPVIYHGVAEGHGVEIVEDLLAANQLIVELVVGNGRGQERVAVRDEYVKNGHHLSHKKSKYAITFNTPTYDRSSTQQKKLTKFFFFGGGELRHVKDLVLRIRTGSGPNRVPLDRIRQGVTKRCRLSWLTNSAVVYEPKCGGSGGVTGSQPMSIGVHMSPNKLERPIKEFAWSFGILHGGLRDTVYYV